MEFNYNQTIEYIDGTRDLIFESAQKWAREHNTTFLEDVKKRKSTNSKKIETFLNPRTGLVEKKSVSCGIIKRFFTIGPQPEIIENQNFHSPNVEPTIEDLKNNKRMERMNRLGFICNDIERYNNQKAAGIPTTDTEEVYMKMLFYAQYLREFCNQKSKWWTEEILSFEDWCKNN